MAEISLILPKDCYSTSQVRRLFARRTDEGKVVPLSRQAIHYRRIKGLLPVIKFSGRYMYPIKAVDAILAKANAEFLPANPT